MAATPLKYFGVDLTLCVLMDYFYVLYNKFWIVHCIYRWVTGYNFLIKVYFFKVYFFPEDRVCLAPNEMPHTWVFTICHATSLGVTRIQTSNNFLSFENNLQMQRARLV